MISIIERNEWCSHISQTLSEHIIKKQINLFFPAEKRIRKSQTELTPSSCGYICNISWGPQIGLLSSSFFLLLLKLNSKTSFSSSSPSASKSASHYISLPKLDEISLFQLTRSFLNFPCSPRKFALLSWTDGFRFLICVICGEIVMPHPFSSFLR